MRDVFKRVRHVDMAGQGVTPQGKSAHLLQGLLASRLMFDSKSLRQFLHQLVFASLFPFVGVRGDLASLRSALTAGGNPNWWVGVA